MYLVPSFFSHKPLTCSYNGWNYPGPSQESLISSTYDKETYTSSNLGVWGKLVVGEIEFEVWRGNVCIKVWRGLGDFKKRNDPSRQLTTDDRSNRSTDTTFWSGPGTDKECALLRKEIINTGQVKKQVVTLKYSSWNIIS